jgi:hypothetical protein
MSGFRKAKAEQAALKLGMYGPPGSGKTFTALLIAEGLAKVTGKRIAYLDTERGTDFYCKSVPERGMHPEAFDFDALYTRSLTETLKEVKGLDPAGHGVIVIDSITHLWEAAMSAYSGKLTKIGTIPIRAWGGIKKPYKALMTTLLSSQMHVIICGRQGIEYETDEETEEMKAVGYKLKAEGETAYEPHILLRMEAIKPRKTNEIATIIAYAEKDRTGVLAGRSFANPTFESLCAPIMPLLSGTQADIGTSEAFAAMDAETLAAQEQQRAENSAAKLKQLSAKLALAGTDKELKDIGKEITPQLKAQMIPADVATLRDKYHERDLEIKSGRVAPTETATSE